MRQVEIGELYVIMSISSNRYDTIYTCNYTRSCSWDDEADCQKIVVC